MSSRSLSYRAGSAKVCITPEESLWMAGYASRSAPSRGKISDLFASALALEDATGNRFVIASADIIAITPIIADQVIEAVRARHRLSRDQLLLVATHTHYGPEFRPDKQVFFNIPAEYAARLPTVANRLAAAILQAIDNALERLEPMRLFVRKTSSTFAHNRRRHGVKYGKASAEDVVDHEVPVLDCVDSVGKRKAIVFGYACHNTTIPPEDRRYCGDWAGFAKEWLEQMNAHATALFLPGAGADQDPEPHGTAEISRQHGEQLASAVQDSLHEPGIEITGSLRAEFERTDLPLAPVERDAMTAMLNSDDPPQRVKARYLLDKLERGESLITSYAVPLQVVRFGNELLLVALSGEPVVDWAHKFKRLLVNSEQEVADNPIRLPFIWVAGYCNDMFGYLPTRRVQAEGGYEGGRANLWSWIPSPFTEEAENLVTDAVHRLISQTRLGD